MRREGRERGRATEKSEGGKSEGKEGYSSKTVNETKATEGEEVVIRNYKKEKGKKSECDERN